MPLRSKAQAARGGEGQRARVARNLADHTGKIAAFEALLQREQGIFGCGSRDMNQPVTQVRRQALKAGPSALPDRRAVLHPQHMAHLLRSILTPGR